MNKNSVALNTAAYYLSCDLHMAHYNIMPKSIEREPAIIYDLCMYIKLCKRL